ncbi:hypothetical protein [Stackebrandtia nassauensis]|uniref:hypothetical protein n=1 Tax=Stackebrandtia nassauensis TaxID=283811 RepID=UPI00118665C7|nr:hypothetical protein [Stackebrandtia nassauensis]
MPWGVWPSAEPPLAWLTRAGAVGGWRPSSAAERRDGGRVPAAAGGRVPLAQLTAPRLGLG